METRPNPTLVFPYFNCVCLQEREREAMRLAMAAQKREYYVNKQAAANNRLAVEDQMGQGQVSSSIRGFYHPEIILWTGLELHFQNQMSDNPCTH